jgi:hypothetical protein
MLNASLFMQYLSCLYAVFTLSLRSIYAYLLYAWYAGFTYYLRRISTSFT